MKKLRVDQRDRLLKLIHKQLKRMVKTMSEISDKIAAASAAIASVEEKLTTLGADLTQEIKEINDKLTAGGGVTPEDLAGLQAIADRLTTVGTTVSGLSDTVKNIVTP
jgi:phage-related protein